jgi:hypothetical protein
LRSGLAEKNPDSGALGERLRALEAWQRTLDEQLAKAGHNAELREAVYAITEKDAAEMPAAWMERDGASLDDLRAALVRMVERIEFDPATGAGRIIYKIEAPPGSGHFLRQRGNREAGNAGVPTGVCGLYNPDFPAGRRLVEGCLTVYSGLAPQEPVHCLLVGRKCLHIAAMLLST